MGLLSPASVALSDQILATLAEEGALPISTTALLEKLNAGQPEPTVEGLLHAARSGQLGAQGTRSTRVYYGDMLRLLNRLARLGEVEKIKLEDMRCLYWRRWPEGSPR